MVPVSGRKARVAVAIAVAGFVAAFSSQVKAYTFTQVDLNIWFGTTNFYSPSNQLLSTNQIVYAATDANGTAATLLPTLGVDLATQIATDPNVTSAGVPGYVIAGLSSLEDSNGLGFAYNGVGTDPAQSQADTQLLAQPPQFSISSDTGWFAVGAPFAFEYIDSFLPDNVSTCAATSVACTLTNVSFFERNVAEQQVPEPTSVGLLATGILMLGFLSGWRRRRRPTG